MTAADSYEAFLHQKLRRVPPTGMQPSQMVLPASLFPFQRDIAQWALRRGRCAVFADTGLGKSRISLSWAANVVKREKRPVLVLAPLAVGAQMAREGAAIGVEVAVCREAKDLSGGVNVTNYERLHKFDASIFGGVVCDESSCIKNADSKTLAKLIEAFSQTPWKLCATATPAPNDYTELGTHAEFLGICSKTEMLAEWFVHDMQTTQDWRLKKHARKAFWKWLASWAALVRKPSDLGYDDGGYKLPPLRMHHHKIAADHTSAGEMGMLFVDEARTLSEQRSARRASIGSRITSLVELVQCDRGVAEDAGSHSCRKMANATAPSSGAYHAAGDADGAQDDTNRLLNEGPYSERRTRPIIEQTETSSQSAPQSSKLSTMSAGEQPTPQIQTSDRRRSPKQSNGGHSTQKNASHNDCGHSALQSSNMVNYSPCRADDAQFATENEAKTSQVDSIIQAVDCISTIAIRQGASEGCSAHRAILGSGSSEMTPNASLEPPHISRVAASEQWIVWCELNAEQDAIAKLLGKTCVSIHGSLSIEEKESLHDRWLSGEVAVIVTKPSLFGMGVNWQHCNKMAFVGVTCSWESYYQAIRRIWRFGQTQPVDVHVFASELEGAVVANLVRKEEDAKAMAEALSAETREAVRAEVGGATRETNEYRPEQVMLTPMFMKLGAAAKVVDQSVTGRYGLYHGDCVDVLRGLPGDSVHYSIYSPPFASLYTYSNSMRDAGNVRSHAEFFEHFEHVIKELTRVIMPGRLMSVHCMDLPTSKERDGFIGIVDFRGDIIRAFQKHGWIYHSLVTIEKDPVTAMQRTKALGLLYKQLRKDSAMSRQGIPDYVVTMRKPGSNTEPVTKDENGFPVGLWQQYANPIWRDIDPSDTLQHRSARENDDERHIAPLQLSVIRKCVRLWTNPGDIVLSPFGGIGSEGWVALQEGRRFLGAELKRSYYQQAAINLADACKMPEDLFAGVHP